MSANKQVAQQSQELLLMKCKICQKSLEFYSENKMPLCKHCQYLQNIDQLSLHESEEVKNQSLSKSPNLKKVKSYSHGSPSDLNKSGIRSFHSLPLQKEQESQDSQEERLKIQEEKLKQAVRKDNLQLKIQKKVIVGSGFTFDMTDFFKFKKKQQQDFDHRLSVEQQQQNFFQSISGSRVAWLILLYTMCSTALIPGWIMNIKATKILRQQWRFFMQALMVIPFVLHQKRTIAKQQLEKYNLQYIFNPNNIIKPYISSLASSLWFLFVLTSFEWTYVTHGIVLGGLSNFFLSIGRSLHKNSHDLQSGGQVLVVLGILLVFHDSISVEKHEIAPYQYNYINTYYLRRTWWERIGGDLLAIFTSFIMSQFSKYTSDLRSYYPPFLSLFLVNCFNVINLTLIAYFFNGATFDLDPFWGIFSIFNDSHFTSFLYMAIVLAFGQMVSVFMVTKMFPDPIIPAIAMTLQPFLACFFIDLGNIQSLPGNFSMIGFILIFPGMILVLMGQCFFQRQKTYKEEVDLRVKKLMEETKQLRQKKLQRITHIQIRKHGGVNSKTYQTNVFQKRTHF